MASIKAISLVTQILKFNWVQLKVAIVQCIWILLKPVGLLTSVAACPRHFQGYIQPCHTKRTWSWTLQNAPRICVPVDLINSHSPYINRMIGTIRHVKVNIWMFDSIRATVWLYLFGGWYRASKRRCFKVFWETFQVLLVGVRINSTLWIVKVKICCSNELRGLAWLGNPSCLRNLPNYTCILLHDDVIKWKHFPRYWPFVRGIHRSPANAPHKGQWRGALMFSLICAWVNGWVNNREAGDLRRHRAHYDVTDVEAQGCLIPLEPRYDFICLKDDTAPLSGTVVKYLGKGSKFCWWVCV